MKSKSDKSFFEFLSSSKSALKIGAIVLFGAVLLLLGAVGGDKSDKVTSDAGEEERIAQMCSMIEGVGDCRVMMTYHSSGEEESVYAVLVLCDGGESVFVKEKITSLLCSLYGIGAHRVEIQKLCD